MVLQTSSFAPLRSLLFHMMGIELNVRPVGWSSERLTAELHTLLIITTGTGSLSLNDSSVRYTADKCFLLSPGTSYRIDNEYDNAVSFYRITFAAIRIGDSRHETYTGNILTDRHELSAYPFTRFVRLAEELYEGSRNSYEIESFKQRIRFQELLGFLVEQNLRSDRQFNSTRSVEGTIQYMRSNYTHNITVKKLAQLANVPYWQYTPIFQELTGKKPLDYLTELRINRSKELLLHSNAPLREIARRVGFADEYYFNRRFRQTTGMTPKQYSRYICNTTRVRDWTGHEVEIPAQPQRIIYYGETFGDLLALGIEAVGNSIHPEQLESLKPDLIILASSDEKQYNKISKVAPTVTFNSFAPLDNRLHTLGNWLGKKREAEQWLKTYNAKADILWKQLRTTIKPGETASVFIYDHGRRLFVMGASGLSSVLYHPSGFQPVDKIREVLDAGKGFEEISAAGLPAYAGDRIFMLIPEKDESRKAMEEMMSSALWRSLPAVRNGRIHVVEAEKWNYGDAMTRERLLDALPPILRSRQAPGSSL
ncbi:ABC transporter substrate-binding protein [Cohnella cholangitidis]|uniref:ABC transporter substrate-binding protein n=1 Tax=Cohnella cholangitidis TaxID=2598458 RepID=A0A7G5C742_9BACL|nr:ABC transporter substrate-binding protein [Cohnella cholangitidis]QMV45026.1 ABC transporter substrate-binding protein [Cohnella cholangitidis]